MDCKMIITLGRQFGSGGREVGKRLAKALDIPFYDKELLSVAAKESGISEELFESNDEKPTNSLLYALAMGNYSSEMPLNHRIFLAQFDAIKKIASEGPCVIVGRCADYALRDYANCVSVFVHAPLEKRIERAITVYNVPERLAQGTISRTDRQRANYYNFYTNKKWGNVDNYELAVDSGSVGLDGAVEIIKAFALLKQEVNLID